MSHISFRTMGKGPTRKIFPVFTPSNQQDLLVSILREIKQTDHSSLDEEEKVKRLEALDAMGRVVYANKQSNLTAEEYRASLRTLLKEKIQQMNADTGYYFDSRHAEVEDEADEGDYRDRNYEDM